MDVLVGSLNDAGFQVIPEVQVSLQNVELDLTFVGFVTRLSRELTLLAETEETVNLPEDLSHLSDWKLEMSSFLKELKCPHTELFEEELNQRLQKPQHRFTLIEYFLDEILAARMVKFIGSSGDGRSAMASHLGAALKALEIQPPPAGISLQKLFSKLMERIAGIEPSKRDKLIGKSLFSGGVLTEQQWKLLNQVSMDLEREYAVRRTMLITRLSATLQSFSWSEKVSSYIPSSIAEAISMQHYKTASFSNISVADMLAARHDLATIEKVSSVAPESRTANGMTKVKVGSVPDRGGRPNEQAPPPPEMPSWQKRSGQSHDAGQFQGGGQKHRGGGQGQRGGYRDQGGYSQGYDQGQGSGYRGDRGGRGGSSGRGGQGGYGDSRNRNRGVQGNWKQQQY